MAKASVGGKRPDGQHLRKSKAIVLRMITGCLLALCASLMMVSASASAATAYVDGISDQSLPYWDNAFPGGYFAGFFRNNWVSSPQSHIVLARYVLQWNVMSGSYPTYQAEFEAWLTDIGSLGITPDLALTSYDGVYPGSSVEYRTRLEQVLSFARTKGHAIRFVEPWNEPNNQGHESAVNAAHFTNEAYSLCESGYSCTVVAGNLEDSPSVGAYENEYKAALNPVPTIWGVHPYYSVEERSEAPIQRFVEHLPNGGSGEQLWFTEVAARKCTDFNGNFVGNGEIGQAERAKWLVNTLIHNRRPEHVFYYEFLLKNRRQPECRSEGADDALFLPGSDPNAPDYPRPAASYIWNGKSDPWGYTGGATSVQPKQATLTASVYPGGFLEAKYHFEYGTTQNYGSYSAEGSTGSGTSKVGVSLPVTLQPGTTYHYRIVAWNAEGSTGGEDYTLTTPGPVEAVTGTAAGVQQTQAVLTGTVNPRNYEARYHFEYGTTTSYGMSTSENSAGAGASPVSEESAIAGLEPGAIYHFRLVATSGGVTQYGQDVIFTTLPEGSPVALRNASSREQWVYSIAANGTIWDDVWNTSKWQNFQIGGAEVPAARGSTVAAILEPSDNYVWLYYTGADGKLLEIYWTGSRFETFGEALPGVEVARGSSPSAVRDTKTKEQWVYYTGTDHKIHLDYWNTVAWGAYETGTSEAVAAGSSPIVVRNPNTKEQWVYYIGADGDIWEIYWTGSAFHSYEIGGTESPAALGSTPAAILEPTDDYVWVYYTGADGQLREIYWTGSRFETFGEVLPGEAVAPGSNPVALRNSTSKEQWVYSVGADRTIRVDWWTGTAWLPYLIGGTEVKGDSGSTPSAILESANNDTWVYYTGGGKAQIWEIYWDGSGFTTFGEPI